MSASLIVDRFGQHSGALDQVGAWVVHAAVWHEVGAILRQLPPGAGLALTGALVVLYVLRRSRRRVSH